MAMATQGFERDLELTYARLQAGLKTKTRDYDWRIGQLRQLKRLIEENEERINDALWKDLRKSKFECQATEQGVVMGELKHDVKKSQVLDEN